jgi:hypothetical protein
MPDEPTLIGATVSFHTFNDDKNADTHLTVTVRQRDDIISARVDDDFGVFHNNEDNGPFALKVINASPKSELQTGNVTIRIDPSDRDTWRFNFFADLIFSDASHLTAQADGIDLAQDRQQQSFGIG